MGFGTGGFRMILIWLVFLVMVVLAIYALNHVVAERKLGQDKTGTVETPMDILKKRYARGEIDEKEFNQKKQNLTS